MNLCAGPSANLFLIVHIFHLTLKAPRGTTPPPNSHIQLSAENDNNSAPKDSNLPNYTHKHTSTHTHTYPWYQPKYPSPLLNIPLISVKFCVLTNLQAKYPPPPEKVKFLNFLNFHSPVYHTEENCVCACACACAQCTSVF